MDQLSMTMITQRHPTLMAIPWLTGASKEISKRCSCSIVHFRLLQQASWLRYLEKSILSWPLYEYTET